MYRDTARSRYEHLKTNFGDIILSDAIFQKGPNFCTKFEPLKDFLVRQASYHFKAQEYKNLQAFDFIQLLNKNMFNGILKICFFPP